MNATYNGGDIKEHYAEAERVLKLCNLDNKIPLYVGANASFEEIRKSIHQQDYDGKEAVGFIIREARKNRDQNLVLLPVGKLTNNIKRIRYCIQP